MGSNGCYSVRVLVAILRVHRQQSNLQDVDRDRGQ